MVNEASSYNHIGIKLHFYLKVYVHAVLLPPLMVRVSYIFSVNKKLFSSFRIGLLGCHILPPLDGEKTISFEKFPLNITTFPITVLENNKDIRPRTELCLDMLFRVDTELSIN